MNSAERVPDPAGLDEFWEEGWKKSVLGTPLVRLRRWVKPKHAQIFDLYGVIGWPAAKVASSLVVTMFHRCQKKK
jgi:hypothetical protein